MNYIVEIKPKAIKDAKEYLKIFLQGYLRKLIF